MFRAQPYKQNVEVLVCLTSQFTSENTIMAGIRIDPSHIDSANASIPPGTPILMLNLLRFRASAVYPDASATNLAPTSGKEAYLSRYIPAFTSIAATVDEEIKPFWIGATMGQLVGANDVLEGAKREEWHFAALVRYPSFETFRQVAASERYVTEALPHRLASLEDWRLIATVEITPEQLLEG